MLSDLIFRLRAIFRREAMDRELDDELRFHLEQQVAKYVALGMTASEAERRARLEFGAVEQVKDESRESRGVSMLETTWRDLRYAARVLIKNRAFAVVAIVSLALGIGANTAIFRLQDAVRLRALPVQAPEELAQVRIADITGIRGSINVENGLSYGVWDKIREQQQAFSGIFAWAPAMLNLSPSGEVRMARALWVSGEFFPVLGIEPALGRLFTPADDYRGCGSPGAVISHSFWQSEFGGERSVIGRKLSLNGHPVEIIGVTPAGFFGLEVGRQFQVALPTCSVTTVRGYDALKSGTLWWLIVMGRLKPAWTAERAAAHLVSISSSVFQAALPPEYPAANVTNYLAMKLTAEPAAAGISNLRNRYSESLWMLLGIGGLVLLIACANLANLMLARASAREREIAVRLAIGASRGRLVRQLVAESLLLASTGAALGFLLSHGLSQVLLSLLASDSGVYLDLRAGWHVLAFTAALAVLTCVIFGLAPALRATRNVPSPTLKAASRGMSVNREQFGLRQLLVVSQVALSLVLLVGALLFVRSLQKLVTADAGFRPEGLLIADLNFVRPNPSQVRVQEFQKALLQRVGAVPGVISVAGTSIVPLGGNSWSNKVWMDGTSPERAPDSLFSRVSAGYFRTLEIPLRAGRDFDERDTLQAPEVAIVNEEFARRIAGAANAVGRRFRVEARPSRPETVYEIVGIAANAKYNSLREDFEPVAFLPYSQDPQPSLDDQLMIRSALPPATLLPAVRRAIAEVDPNARFAFQDYSEVIRDSVLPERLMATLSGAFGVLAGLLTAVGLYGVISYLVARRKNEIGIRIALGADRRRILTMVLRESGRLVLIGVAAGAALSLYAATFARTMLYRLQPYDPATLVAAAALLLLVALAATWLPARRAAALDPMVALRDE